MRYTFDGKHTYTYSIYPCFMYYCQTISITFMPNPHSVYALLPTRFFERFKNIFLLSADLGIGSIAFVGVVHSYRLMPKGAVKGIMLTCCPCLSIQKVEYLMSR